MELKELSKMAAEQGKGIYFKKDFKSILSYRVMYYERAQNYSEEIVSTALKENIHTLTT